MRWADYLDIPVQQESELGMLLTLVPPGRYLMGASEDDAIEQPFISTMHPAKGGNMLPRRTVRISSPMLIGTREVTVGQYRVFAEQANHTTDAENSPTDEGTQPTWSAPGFEQPDTNPVSLVSWSDATAFCTWLSGKEGRPFRLLTEAEWEYACRAGTYSRWSYSDDFEETIRRSSLRLTRENPNSLRPTDPNAFGLYDMHGSLSEWCRDVFSVDAYKLTPTQVEDPMGPIDKDSSRRVARGGSYKDGIEGWYCRSAVRRGRAKTFFSPHFGFRVTHPISLA